MPLDKSKCKIPKVWCGNGNPKNKEYIRNGTKYECMKQGFGAGSATERLKHLPANSLQRIKYIGEKMEANFKKEKITSIPSLITRCKKMTPDGIEKLLKRTLKKEGGSLDGRAYNSTILFLDANHIDTPQCKKLT